VVETLRWLVAEVLSCRIGVLLTATAVAACDRGQQGRFVGRKAPTSNAGNANVLAKTAAKAGGGPAARSSAGYSQPSGKTAGLFDSKKGAALTPSSKPQPVPAVDPPAKPKVGGLLGLFKGAGSADGGAGGGDAGPDDGPNMSLGLLGMLSKALTKFKDGGKKNHEEWVARKNLDRINKIEAELGMAEAELKRTQQEFEANQSHQQRLYADRAQKEAEKRQNMKMRLLEESSQLDFVPSRPNSGMVLDPMRPSEDEAWELGLEVLRMRDELDSVAPGGNPKAAARREKQYPRKLPKPPDPRYPTLRNLPDQEQRDAKKL